jgi:uncharacterized protein (TIGR03435 family)
MRATAMAIVIVLGAGFVGAQGPDARPAYEVASIKPNNSTSNSSSSKGTTGQIVMTNQTLKRLVERAYNVKPFQVSGPEWMENVRFDIIAKYPPDTKNEERMLMLRTLLEERFGLLVHRESKSLPGYTLVAAKGGFKLRSAESDGGGSHINTTGSLVEVLDAGKVSMQDLADFVAEQLGETVVDKTGIDGVYDFGLRWSRDDLSANGGDSGAPTLFTALQETLGLRLQPEKVPVEIIVVDHAERIPNDN